MNTLLLLWLGITSQPKAMPLPLPEPVRLQCEYLVNPLGIDAAHPRLAWQLEDNRQSAVQTAWQLSVGTDSLSVAAGKGNSWQTGKTLSDQQRVVYAGKPLQPFTKYYWRVTLWDKDGKPSTGSAVASFETGMMREENWKGFWISDSRDVNEKKAPYFRKQIRLNKPVKSARAYIAAGGLYELYINGANIGDQRLNPMMTRYDRRTLYLTYDVTPQLRNGDNTIGVLLGNGWYNHQPATEGWYFNAAPWRNRPTYCLNLRVTYEDGTVETISTDKTWKTSFGGLVYSNIYTADHYDARQEQEGWNKNGFDDAKWKEVVYRSAPSPHIVAQAMQPIRYVETIHPKSVKKINDTVYLFDLGRNIAGVSRITVSGKAGTTLRLKHTERLDKNGRADMSNIGLYHHPTDASDPFQVDFFTLSGKGTESFTTLFGYKGFQYVEVSADAPVELNAQSITGYFMHSDVPPVGKISSSNPVLDKIWWANNNSYLSNLYGYPTDCPQREKNGWTGDANIAIETGLYSFDGITVYEKWMADHRDEQLPNGVLPAIIPTSGWGYEWANGPDWTSTIAIIPWNIYLFYGDTKILEDNYDNLRRYVNYIQTISPDGLTTWGLGDWVPVKSVANMELTSSAFYFTDASILAKIAKVLGREDDYRTYKALAQKIKAAINKKFLNTTTGIYASGLQTEQSVPLHQGLVPEELKSKVVEQLAKRVAADNYHLDVGILGAKAILNALSENGYADVAYTLAAQETYPSWGWWIVNGATTFYENWKIDAARDISMNHVMFGEVAAWLYKGPGGIKPDPRQPGFRNVLLQPHFVKGLDHFEARHTSPYGEIVSSWKREGGAVMYEVTIPPNATGEVFMQPGQKWYEKEKQLNTAGTVKLKAGHYQFVIL
ncbi:alpha-L-rhamnosidase [Chitinophaga defluvii]|uniref:alpha-L-rhamnosidase n=1 Tax=Chitinophaga defluvii TaxID=3163343 RepID=A0ABV2T1C9_9BACT